MNRGQGIHVANTFKRVKKLIRDYCRGREIDQNSGGGCGGQPNNKVHSSSTVNNNNNNGDLISQIMALNESQTYAIVDKDGK
jgi:hypothetical protein